MGEKLYHIGFGDEHGAKYVILPGDPGRVEKTNSFALSTKAFVISRFATAGNSIGTYSLEVPSILIAPVAII